VVAPNAAASSRVTASTASTGETASATSSTRLVADPRFPMSVIRRSIGVTQPETWHAMRHRFAAARLGSSPELRTALRDEVLGGAKKDLWAAQVSLAPVGSFAQ
jgi:hypothetical protein